MKNEDEKKKQARALVLFHLKRLKMHKMLFKNYMEK